MDHCVEEIRKAIIWLFCWWRCPNPPILVLLSHTYCPFLFTPQYKPSNQKMYIYCNMVVVLLTTAFDTSQLSIVYHD
jgi:hypothetical protein